MKNETEKKKFLVANPDFAKSSNMAAAASLSPAMHTDKGPERPTVWPCLWEHGRVHALSAAKESASCSRLKRVVSQCTQPAYLS